MYKLIGRMSRVFSFGWLMQGMVNIRMDYVKSCVVAVKDRFCILCKELFTDILTRQKIKTKK